MRTHDDKLIFEALGKRMYFTTLHDNEDEVIWYNKKWYIPRLIAFYKFYTSDPVGKGVRWNGYSRYSTNDDYYGVITSHMDIIIHDNKRIQARLIYIDTPENLQLMGQKIAKLPQDGRDLLDI